LTSSPLFGLIELTDNNPIVCADVFSVPGPAETLLLLALGPLCRAGLLLEPPVFVTNVPCQEESLSPWLAPLGWSEGIDLHEEAHDMGSVLAGSGIAAIFEPDSLSDIDDLYDECFGRSFFVRRSNPRDWSPEVVRGHPFAAYDISISSDGETALVSVRVLADAAGKCGAAQLVHAFNVMNGFEESLGINP
jgi:N-acetyl-gamma-glutamylphosphate reductase